MLSHGQTNLHRSKSSDIICFPGNNCSEYQISCSIYNDLYIFVLIQLVYTVYIHPASPFHPPKTDLLGPVRCPRRALESVARTAEGAGRQTTPGSILSLHRFALCPTYFNIFYETEMFKSCLESESWGS